MTTKIAIIGAGIAGAHCARQLQAAGFSPVVFEKSRGLGGRLATRRMAGGIQFDHGAQFMTASSAEFGAALAEAEKCGSASLWKAFENPAESDHPGRFVGTPTMNALVKPWLDDVDVRLKTRVSAIARHEKPRHEKQWRLSFEVDQEGAAPDNECFDIVVSTVPAPQAEALVSFDDALMARLKGVTIFPCWAFMATATEKISVDFDVWRSRGHAIAWAARDSSKPGRSSGSECWVLHASPEWSDTHLECDSDTATAMITPELRDIFGDAAGQLDIIAAHRWRYAMTGNALGEAYLSDATGTFFVAGDWCLGAKVEAAFESGAAVAVRVINAAQ